MDKPSAVFVYGTLMRGEVREGCWPRKPDGVETASVRGALFDLGPYPGLVEGEDVVLGEVWTFGEEDLAATLEVLDEIEGVRGRADDEYRRVVMECETKRGNVSAWAYVYERLEALNGARRVKPDEHGCCSWHGSATRAS